MRLSVTAALVLLVPSLAGAQIPAAEYAARRQALVASVDSGVALVFGAEEPERFYPGFIQLSPFLYFAGFDEAGAALLIVKRGGQVTSTLFAQPSEPAVEVWTGRRSTFGAIRDRLGVPVRTFSAMRPALDSLLASGLPLYFVTDHQGSGEYAGNTNGPGYRFVGALRAVKGPGLQVGNLDPVADQLRSRKSAAEFALIQRATEITVRAHRDVMRLIEPGMNEFEAQALIEYTIRRNGADRPAFASIVASGANSTTLHYMRDDRFMHDGEVLVMDIGASYRGYAADVTRTVPVNGTFSPEQRAVYQIVRDAQSAAEGVAKADTPWSTVTRAAGGTIAQGLTRLGLIQAPDAVYDAREGECARPAPTGCLQWSLFYMHGLGHGIGLDVHDPDQLDAGMLRVGSAFTIEPGIYVRGNTLDLLPDTPRNRAVRAAIAPAVRKHANIGIRIEDDYIITPNGTEWISRAPREMAEIEALMREPYAGPSPRDARIVDWYKQN